jgi:CRP-like cAMP-binding protein
VWLLSYLVFVMTQNYLPSRFMNHPTLVDRRLLQFFIPVKSLTEDHLQTLLRDTQVEYLYQGQTLFTAGDNDGQHIYLLHGELTLTDAQGNERVLNAQDEKNCVPVAQSQPRQHTVVALSDCSIIRFNSVALDNMLCWDQAASYISLDITAQRDLDEDADWMLTLLNSNLFYKIPPMNIRAVLNHFQPLVVDAGDVIVRQGQLGDCLYVIKEGEADVYRADSPTDASQWVATLSPGKCFGEDALVNETERNATVKMRTSGVLMRLDKKSFYQLLKKSPVNIVSLARAEELVAQEGARWLDVRTLDEYELGHIPKALHMALDLLKLKQRKLDKDTTTSLKALALPMGSPPRLTMASSKKRFSVIKSPSSTTPTFFSISSGEISVKNPKRPRFTPSTGTPCLAKLRAAPSMLPSPPTTITRSQASPIRLRVLTCKPCRGRTLAISSSRMTLRPRSTKKALSTFRDSMTRSLPIRPIRPILRNGSMHSLLSG